MGYIGCNIALLLLAHHFQIFRINTMKREVNVSNNETSISLLETFKAFLNKSIYIIFQITSMNKMSSNSTKGQKFLLNMFRGLSLMFIPITAYLPSVSVVI